MRGRCEEGMDDSDDDEDIPLLVGADDVEVLSKAMAVRIKQRLYSFVMATLNPSISPNSLAQMDYLVGLAT
jgi:hypothetical protein